MNLLIAGAFIIISAILFVIFDNRETEKKNKIKEEEKEKERIEIERIELNIKNAKIQKENNRLEGELKIEKFLSENVNNDYVYLKKIVLPKESACLSDEIMYSIYNGEELKDAAIFSIKKFDNPIDKIKIKIKILNSFNETIKESTKELNYSDFYIYNGELTNYIVFGPVVFKFYTLPEFFTIELEKVLFKDGEILIINNK
jgi:hypothetical protein